VRRPDCWLFCLLENIHDGDCGFLVVDPSNFGGVFRSAESLGRDRTVAATAPSFWILDSGFWILDSGL
jgi:hypothetical protein